MKVQVSGKDRVVVRMSGKLNESADLQMVSLPPVSAVEIDLVDLTHINSIGIRNFRDWLLTVKAPELAFSYCPRVFIDQVNMVMDFLPKHAKVLSFYVPYYSDATGEDKLVLFTRGKEFQVVDGEVKLTFPEVLDSKGKEMDVDVIGDRYFGFLSKY